MADGDKNFPFEISDLPTEQIKEIKNYFNGPLNTCTVRVGPKAYIFPREYERIGKDIYNMEVRPSDIFVVTFPKSGTTWTQELVWLIANNFDYEKAIMVPLDSRYPFIDMRMFVKEEFIETLMQDEKIRKVLEMVLTPAIDKLKLIQSPRFLKSHLPMSLLPPKLLDTCKMVYVARNPKDVAVSYFHHAKLMSMCTEDRDFKRYWNFFYRDLVHWSPFFEHVKEAWTLRNHPNMLFLFYEELSKDLPTIASRVAKFLDKQITEEQIANLCEHLKFDNFKNNKAVNWRLVQEIGMFNKNENFIRRGKVGGWRDYFDEEMTEQAERWIEENLRDTDLRFPEY